MNIYLENILTMLSTNELYQLGIILNISSNGTRKDILKKINKSYKFNHVYSKILDLSKYKYFRKCISVYKQNHIIMANNRLSEEDNIMEHDYILYNNVECNICNHKTTMHEYDNHFFLKIDKNEPIKEPEVEQSIESIIKQYETNQDIQQNTNCCFFPW